MVDLFLKNQAFIATCESCIQLISFDSQQLTTCPLLGADCGRYDWLYLICRIAALRHLLGMRECPPKVEADWSLPLLIQFKTVNRVTFKNLDASAVVK